MVNLYYKRQEKEKKMKEQFTRGRRPNGSKPTPVRSVRVPDELWAAANRRAAYEGVTMSHVLAVFTEGYAQGLIDLPRVTVQYRKPRDPSAPTEPQPVGVQPQSQAG